MRIYTLLLITSVLLGSGLAACTETVPPPNAAVIISSEVGPEAIEAVEPTADGDLEALKQRWRDGRYAEVLPALLQYRKEQPYGKNEIVDYMIGTSACRIPEKRTQGYEFLRWMLQHYPLNDASRAMVEREMEQCVAPPAAAGGGAPVLLVSQNMAVSGPGVSGKMFYDLTRGEDLPLSNEPVEVVRMIPPDTLAARLFAPSARPAALEALQRRVGAGFTVAATESFVLASAAHGPEDLAAIGQALDRLLRFYTTTYHLTPPDRLITVYLVTYVGTMRDLAEQIHGLRLAYQSIGYSMRDDLSMVGVIPGRIYGTLAHELFHLMVRRDFGDIPPWLDEGTAALYEVARSTPAGVQGTPNWRGPVLQRYWSLRPTVDALVRMDWRGFENADNAYESARQMANHATARYFMLFLQERGQLVDVFHAFRDRPVTADGTDPADDAAHLLETVLEQPLDTVDRDFVAWFSGLEH